MQLVPDVEPYELMKLRLLNAAHQAMSYPALLDGHTFVHEVCQQPDYAQFLLDYMTLEARPTLRPVPGIDLDAYSHDLIARFSNPAIQDTLARLIVDGSERIPKFLLPVAREQAARIQAGQGGDLRRCALVVAAWSAYVAQAATRGDRLDDVRAADLTHAALAAQVTPGAFLHQPDVFGDLSAAPAFVQAYLDARAALAAHGPLGALRALHAAPPKENTHDYPRPLPPGRPPRSDHRGAQGIGFEIARGLAQAGARVTIADLNPDVGQAAAATLDGQFEVLNVTDAAAVAALARKLPDVDILVNNAGIVRNTPPRPPRTTTGAV